MNHMSVSIMDDSADSLPKWLPDQPDDDVLPLYPQDEVEEVQHLKDNPTGRRSWFSNKQKREAVTIRARDVLNMDFCNGYLDFNTFALKVIAI